MKGEVALTPVPADGLVRLDLRGFHESSAWRPFWVFVLAFAAWVGVLGLGLWVDRWARVALVLPLAMLSGWLFTLGHDAGHQSFSTSRRVNAVVGRLALVPSVHVFGLWRVHHDAHHRYTNLRGSDFVWTPLSVAEYRALPRWRRLMHRIHRHRSGLGLGLHYATEIWVSRMVWPRRRHELRDGRRHWADAAMLYGSLFSLAVVARGFVGTVAPERVDDFGYWVSAVVLLFVLPLTGTHWLIGFVIYLNHTHPDVVWYDDPAEWSRRAVQLEGSVGLCFRRGSKVLLPQRIMFHTVHHVDPGVPLRKLDAAQRHFVAMFGDRIVTYDWSPSAFRDVLSRCKLYDYDTRSWLTYASAAHRP